MLNINKGSDAAVDKYQISPPIIIDDSIFRRYTSSQVIMFSLIFLKFIPFILKCIQ